MKYFCYCFVLASYLSASYAVNLFWNGRKIGGNIGVAHDPTGKRRINPRTDMEQWFTQRLDHFYGTSDATWQQRYFMNDKSWTNRNGPVFLFIGGEGEASASWLNSGAMARYAEKHEALVFILEHRFYGKSHPLKSLSVKNLQFLSTEQALADLAYFVTAMNEKFNMTVENKWIAFGGSYPGNLAVWLRKKYAHLIHGAISSSAPLLAKVDFAEYYEVVMKSLGTYKPCDCVDSVRKAFQQINLSLKDASGRVILSEKLNFCIPFNGELSPRDTYFVIKGIADQNLAGVVQSNSGATIDEICNVFCDNSVGSNFDRLAKVNKIILGESCLGINYMNVINGIKNCSWNSPDSVQGSRQWLYQTCTEFGYYQTSSKTQDVFRGDLFPVEFAIQQCKDMFGMEFNGEEIYRGVNRTNTFYGALRPATTNVLHIQNSLDPWHALGLIETNNNQPEPTVFVEGSTHCDDMQEPRDSDSPQMKAARQKIGDFLSNLLAN